MSNDIYSFDEVLKHCPVNEDVEFIYQGDLFTDKMGTSAGENLIDGDSYFMEHYHTGMVTGCMSIQFFSTNGLYNMTIEYRNERFSEKYVKSFAEDFFTVAESLRYLCLMCVFLTVALSGLSRLLRSYRMDARTAQRATFVIALKHNPLHAV